MALSYGGDDAGKSSPINLKSGSSSASHKQATSYISPQTCTARHADKSRSRSGNSRTTPQGFTGSTETGDWITEKDKDAAVIIRRSLSHVDGKTQYFLQYCIEAFNESNLTY